MRVRRPDGGAAGSTQERLNREARRRAGEAGIFQDRDALIPCVHTVIAEQHDVWTGIRRCIGLDIVPRSRATSIAALSTPRR
jgi:hypothetical protein